MGKGTIEMKELPEIHQKGMVSIEQNLKPGIQLRDFGIQIANDGRIWICIDGMATIRFKPLSKEAFEFLKKEE
jgi:hypothetical protein